MTYDFGAYTHARVSEWLDELTRVPQQHRKRNQAAREMAQGLQDIDGVFDQIAGLALETAEFDKDIHDGFLEAWKEPRLRQEDKQIVGISFDPPPVPVIDIDRLPPYSWYLNFEFELARPVVTKQEEGPAPTENMFRKERATGCPVFAASSWKGAFAAAMRQAIPAEQFDQSHELLFGGAPSESEAEDSRRGRLTFFTSFFDRLSIYVINPQDRKTKTGKPIIYEAIPEGGCAWFSLLYCPLADAYLSPTDELKKEHSHHLTLVRHGIYSLFRQCGFGGKTSSGFGLAENRIRHWSFSPQISQNRLQHIASFDQLHGA
jgi:CRISPR-associated protein Cmr2